VLLLRGRDGLLRAFLNVCRHRGARLCTEAEGQVRRNLRCATTLDLRAGRQLVAAPNIAALTDDAGAPIDRYQFGLVPVALTEWLGYAWVCLSDAPPPFDDVIAETTKILDDPDAINRYGIGGLEVGRRIVYDVKANWKLIVENFMECYHCATIHPELTEVLPEFADGFAAQYFVGHGAVFGEDVQGFTVDGSEGVEKLPGVTDDQDRRYYAVTIRPNVFVNLVPDHVIFHRMFPIAPDHTIVECERAGVPGREDEPAEWSCSTGSAAGLRGL
jgi:Rieske 2Fe-2S family protein